jgi:SAM-dependent methyltransferase
MGAYDLLADRPEPFSAYTTPDLWCDPHIARRMLAAHLSPDTDQASPRPALMDQIVAWIDQQADLGHAGRGNAGKGKTLLDLGCGPGLFANRFSELGAQITGLDISTTSLEYAIEHQVDASMQFIQCDYLHDDLPGGQQIVTLISRDYCALSPAQRAALLANIGRALTDDGLLIFDINTLADLADISESMVVERNLMNGFFSSEDYVGLKRTLLYAGHNVSLDHYLIMTPDGQREFYNWATYFSQQAINTELRQADFRIVSTSEGLTGQAVTDQSRSLGLVAAPAG